MRVGHVLQSFAAFLLLSFTITTSPASARRTVIDGGFIRTVDGYCAPDAVGTADCAPQSLPFALQIGGVTYDSFVVNGNTTLSLGGPIDFADATGTLSDYGVPVFSPLIDNRLVDLPNMFTGDIETDTFYSAVSSTAPNSLTVQWFPCSTNVFCGPLSVDDPFSTFTPEELDALQAMFTFGLTLTLLDDGFSLTYFYNSGANSAAPYGFFLPGGAQLQTSGAPIEERSWIFDANGQLVSQAPEPSTWLTMLIGFGMVGFALRRRKQAQAALA